MRKYYFLFAFFLLGYLSINAQWGSRIGVDLAKVEVEVSDSYESVTGSDNYTGYYFGIFNNFELSDFIGIRPELNYYYFPKENESNLVDQIQIPLLLTIKFAKVISLMIGPSASYLINVQGDAKSVNYSGNLGLAIGLGDALQIEGRYVRGFANLAGSDSGFNVTTNLNAIHVGLTYSLD